MTEVFRGSAIPVDEPVIDITVSSQTLKWVSVVTQLSLYLVALYLLVTLLFDAYLPDSVNSVICCTMLCLTFAHVLPHLLPLMVKQPGRYTCSRVQQREVRLSDTPHGVAPMKSVLVKCLALADSSLLPFCLWFLVFSSSKSPIVVNIFASLLHLIITNGSSHLYSIGFYCTISVFSLLFLAVRFIYVHGLMVTRLNPFLRQMYHKQFLFFLVVSAIVGFTEISIWSFFLSALPCDGLALNSVSVNGPSSVVIEYPEDFTNKLTVSLAGASTQKGLAACDSHYCENSYLPLIVEKPLENVGEEVIHWYLRFEKDTLCLSAFHKVSIVCVIVFWSLSLVLSDVVLGTLRKLTDSCCAAGLPSQEKVDALFTHLMRLYRICAIILCICSPTLFSKHTESTSGKFAFTDTNSGTNATAVSISYSGVFARIGTALIIAISSMWMWLSMRNNGFIGRRLIASTDHRVHTWYQRLSLKMAGLSISGVLLILLIYFIPVVALVLHYLWWGIWLCFSLWDGFHILFR